LDERGVGGAPQVFIEATVMATSPAPKRAAATHDWAPRRPRLTRAQITAIQARRADRYPYKFIASEFGISITHAWRVCQR
jgi:hypothetical protein